MKKIKLLKNKEILLSSLIFFIFYSLSAIIIVIDRFSDGFILRNFSPFIFGFNYIFEVNVAGGGTFLAILYLIILSILSSFVLFCMVKLVGKKIYLPKITLILVLGIVLFFLIISFVGGIPNRLTIEVRDSKTNELVYNIELEIFEWKGNIINENACKRDINLKNGMASIFKPFSVGFTTYINDERYYKNFIDHKFFDKSTIYVTKKPNMERLPGNYNNSYSFEEPYFIGCVKLKTIGFDFSKGIPDSPDNADITLDVDCNSVTFETNDKIMRDANIIALDNAGVINKGNEISFYALTEAPLEGYGKNVLADSGNSYYVKTKEGKYAKFKIDFRSSSFNPNTYYSKMIIIWAYQPDGSRNLATEDYFVSPYSISKQCK